MTEVYLYFHMALSYDPAIPNKYAQSKSERTLCQEEHPYSNAFRRVQSLSRSLLDQIFTVHCLDDRLKETQLNHATKFETAMTVQGIFCEVFTIQIIFHVRHHLAVQNDRQSVSDTTSNVL